MLGLVRRNTLLGITASFFSGRSARVRPVENSGTAENGLANVATMIHHLGQRMKASSGLQVLTVTPPDYACSLVLFIFHRLLSMTGRGT